MSAEFGREPIRLYHHGHGVPAYERANAPLHCSVAGKALLFLYRYGIEIGSVGAERQIGAGAAGFVDETLQQIMRAFDALVLEHGIQGVEPFLCLLWVDVGLVGHVHS